MSNCEEKTVSESQKGWEEVTAKFRDLCVKQIEQTQAKISLNQVQPADLISTGQLLQMAFDLEQISKVFDANVKHSIETMKHKKKQYQFEQEDYTSRGKVGFVSPESITYFDSDDEDFIDEDFDEDEEW